MCGIAGIYGLEQLPNAASHVNRMVDRMEHRGPDASGVFEGKNVVLGHRRLSIIDLNKASDQPFTSADGRYTVVYNGELYNYRTLRAQLSAYDFRTDSDTEVVLAALIQWGMKALQLFNGMFAFAFWDNEEEQLWIARDRMGIKPLYYAQPESSFMFASEIRSLLASGLIDKRLNREALSDYLRYQTVHAPHTIIDGVKMLMPGTYWQVSEADAKPVEYWKPWQKLHFDRDPIKVQKEVRDRLTASVDQRMVSDVPFGAFLSGGIDSSLIVGIIRERLNLPLDTFNVSFDDGPYSEGKFAREVADRFGANHHEIMLKPDAFLSSLPDALGSMDHPSGDGPNTWIVSKETKQQGISMALSGLGGDELFAGYDVFTRIPYVADRHWILSFPKGLRSLVGSVLEMTKQGFRSAKTKEILEADYFDLQHLYPIFRKVLLDDQVAKLLANDALKDNHIARILKELEAFHEFGQLPTLSRISVAEMSTYLQNVLLRDTDQMSMAHALEVRVPFLDHELVEYVLQVSDGIKYPSTPKKLLIDSFADLLPDHIVGRKKMGFILPWQDWLQKELHQFAEERINRAAELDYFNAQAIQELWSRFLRNDPMVTWSRVWPIITLVDWMERNEVE